MVLPRGVPAGMSSEDILHYETFAPFLQDPFTATHTDGTSVVFQLVEVNLLDTWSLEDSPRKPFELLLKVVEGELLSQCTLTLKHENAGSWSMFCVPILMPRSGRYVQVIYN